MNHAEQVNIHYAKTHLSRLVADVARGAQVIIAKAGKPMAMLVPIAPVRRARKPGFVKGRIKIADDFDATLPTDVLAGFEGRR